MTRLAGHTLEEKLSLNVRLDGECRRWTGAHTASGYGHIRVDGKARQIHRLAHEIWIGPIPDGHEVDHLCRVRDCINLAHLESVTHEENVRRAMMAITCCPQGHEYTPQNIKWEKVRGRYRGRRCRTCFNIRRAATRRQRRTLKEGPVDDLPDLPEMDPHIEVFTVRTTDRHGRPLGGERERDGRLLAAAQGIDLTEGSCDNGTREYWYRRADEAREQLAAYEREDGDRG